jgi:hypothetical protein
MFIPSYHRFAFLTSTSKKNAGSRIRKTSANIKEPTSPKLVSVSSLGTKKEEML